MTQPEITDLDRDAVALIAAVLDHDDEGLAAIVAGADLPRLAVLMAGGVIGMLECSRG